MEKFLVKDPKLKQKTRSMAYHDRVGEHDAFRVTLLWLWRKCRIALGPLGPGNFPEHVREALAPMELGALKPCAGCMSGNCKYLDEAPARLLALIPMSVAKATAGDISAFAGSSDARDRSGGVFVPVGSSSSSSRACCICGNDPATGDPPFCSLCHDMDACVWHKRASVEMRPKPDQGMRLEMNGSLVAGGRGWHVRAMPGDGNCLFAAMTTGKLCLLDRSKSFPTPEAATRWAQQSRRSLLDFMGRHIGRVLFDGLPMEALVRASTGMSPQQYLDYMKHPVAADRRTWGGFLEAAVMCARWQCRVVFFVVEAGQLRSWSFVGSAISARHHNRGRISLLWSGGGHYDLLVLDDSLLEQLA
jgi:hypothetical protein